jgi:hypothetical protein
VVIAGGGTAGVFAAIAAARNGATTILIENKGYVGGIAVEGGTALHSFFNLYSCFNVPKVQLVKGIPHEFIERLTAMGGCSGHAEMSVGFCYDAVATVIDTELYKLLAFEMLEEAGVIVLVNTLLVDAIATDGVIQGVITESRSGREAIFAKSFVDTTGYGDLAAFSDASFVELNDHAVANSIGVGGLDIDAYHAYLHSLDQVSQCAEGIRSGEVDKIVRVDAHWNRMPPAFNAAANAIGMSFVTTTIHDDYLMFIKLNYKMEESPTNRDAVAKAEVELRRRQHKAIQLLRQYVPGAEKAFIARTSPSLCIRRGRTIACDYDVTIEDIVEGRHFADDVYCYGFHDAAPRIQIKDGGSFGFPYRAMLPQGVQNLLCAGMMVTTSWEAHMSTRNTVSVMAMGQAAGTAAALCVQKDCHTRALPYVELREQLEKDEVVFVE